MTPDIHVADDSRERGFLHPVETGFPLNDFGDDLDNALHDVVVGITGLPPTMVRPRWQPENAHQPPEHATDWCGVGVLSVRAEVAPSIAQKPGHLSAAAPPGYQVFRRHEEITAQASFYGAHAHSFAARLQDGLYQCQNNDELRFRGLALVEAEQLITTADLVNMNWRRRIDLNFTLRRAVTRVYPIRSLKEAHGFILPQSGEPTKWNTEKKR